MEEKLKYFNIDRNSFNPWDYAQDNQSGGKFLPLSAKKAWFRTRYPEGNIRYKVITEAEGYIVVEAMVYAERKDPDSEYLGYGISFATFDQVYSNNFKTDLERHLGMRGLAYGKAAARALTDAGFGLQFYIDEPDPEEFVPNPGDVAVDKVNNKDSVSSLNTASQTADFAGIIQDERKSVDKVPQIAKVKHLTSSKKEIPAPLLPNNEMSEIICSSLDKCSMELDVSSSDSAAKENTVVQTDEPVVQTDEFTEGSCEFDQIPSMNYAEALTVKVDCGTLSNRSNPDLSKSINDILNSTQISKLSYVFQKTKSETVKSAIKTIVERDANLMKYFFSKGLVNHL